MRHQNSVFPSLTKHIPWSKFEQIVEKHGADQLVRKLTTKCQFIALLYGQFRVPFLGSVNPSPLGDGMQ